MNKIIYQTDFYIDRKFISDFESRELQAKKYNPPFKVVDHFYTIGDPTQPLTSIPKELQVFDDTIVYIYIFDMSETLEWHIDEMRLDYLATAKYAAILEGRGTLEVKIDDTTESFLFEERNRWVKFPNTKPHRFIVHEPCKMIMAITLDKEEAAKFNNSYFWSTEVDAINKIVYESKKI
jgi:hypothetical protein